MEETRQSYDAIARAYLERKRDHPLDGYLRDLLDRFCQLLPAQARVADLGCGHGFEVRALLDRGMRPVGIDLSAGMLACAAELVPGRLVRADLRRLPFPEATLDGVWSVHALLHVPAEELPGVLAGVHRALRPGGVAALSLAGHREGEGERREEVAYWPGRYRTFVHWRPERLRELAQQVGLAVDLVGHAPEAGRDTLWLLARATAAHPAEDRW